MTKKEREEHLLKDGFDKRNLKPFGYYFYKDNTIINEDGFVTKNNGKSIKFLGHFDEYMK